MQKLKTWKGKAAFQTQGRLLQELGERLVARPDVALLELIKNAYDADATECQVQFDGQKIEIRDDGHGMTEEEFLDKWMHIATPDKQRERESRLYKRTVTGSKGIGRFAVRFLGRRLRLTTVADVSSRKGRTRLSIEFDWQLLDEAPQLHVIKIDYAVKQVSSTEPTGTVLSITDLRDPENIDFGTSMRTELLSIIDPYSGLRNGGYGRIGRSRQDPGFQVDLPKPGSDEKDNPIDAILRNAYASLTIKHKKTGTHYRIQHKDGRVLLDEKIKKPTHIARGFYADIRYCPRRAGMFRKTGVDGRQIWSWLKSNGGIGIVDHGFRIRPYGFRDDDWLGLGLDSGHNRRDWRVEFMNELYPMPADASSQPKLNPMLYLPSFHQLVGAVFVESSQEFDAGRPTDLTPSMDREGFIDNEGFRELHDLVRAGLEMLAYVDHKEQRRLEAKAAKAAVAEMRKDFRAAIKYVEGIPTLSEGDREQVVERFESLASELKDVQDYHRVAISKMETVGLLGVLAGFLTHEMKRLVHDLDTVIRCLEKQPSSKQLKGVLDRMKKTRDEIAGQVQFAATFVANVQAAHVRDAPLNVASQVQRIVDRFRQFIEDRSVDIEYDIDDSLSTPSIPVALYSGVLLNLISNALKAVFGGQGAAAKPRVTIKAWNEPKYHVVEVADTGVGIPEELAHRIWDPLFTTTSGGGSNPLGSGMGLGLSLVHRLVSGIQGKIHLVEPPPGYHTCFRVQFPFKRG